MNNEKFKEMCRRIEINLYRKVKKMAKKIMLSNNINPDDYNLNKIVSYETEGTCFTGKSIKTNYRENRTPLSFDYSYTVYEIPKKGNENKIKGEYFIVFFEKKHFSYLFATFKNNSSSRELKFLNKITLDDDGNGKDIYSTYNIFVFKNPDNKFDPDNNRKKAYLKKLV